MKGTLFPNGLGQVVVTESVARLGFDVSPMIARHLKGEWGKLDREDLAQNEREARTGGMVLSKHFVGRTEVWVITDPGHDTSTVLLPQDY